MSAYLQGTTWTFGKWKQDDVLSAAFLPPPADGAVTLATGMTGGDVCLWRSGAAIGRVSLHSGKPRPGFGCARRTPTLNVINSFVRAWRAGLRLQR